jgi:glyoxylase-like metal-dependent hydrolase (beta-lactamase superfamily II)
MKDTEIFIIMAEHFHLDGGACFGVVPRSIWSMFMEPNENHMVPVCNRCLLVRDGERLILIDNGIGDKHDEKFLKYQYLFGDDSLVRSLARQGIKADDITDVLLTHLHYDHCGGGVKYNEDRTGLVLTFPNATYWCSKTQWECAMHPNAREGASYFKDNFMPAMESGRLKFIETEGKFSDHISLKIYYGHTSGQVIPHISHRGRTIVFMADFIPTHYHIPLPYVPSYDTQPLVTMKEKEEFLNCAADNDYILFFEHDPDHEACTLMRTAKGIRYAEEGALKKMLSLK